MTLPEAAFWGFLGAFAIGSLDLHAVWLRYHRLPWFISIDIKTGEPYVNENMSPAEARQRMWEYIVAEASRCMGGAVVAIVGAASAGQHASTLLVSLFGAIESPLLFKRFVKIAAMMLESYINPHGRSAAIVRSLNSLRHKVSQISNDPGSADDEGKEERL